MKSLAFLLCGILLLLAPPGQSAGVAGVETVYLLPMGSSLDQFLANQLTSQGVLRVVADPRKADAVFTDHLGKDVQAFLDEIQPTEEAKEAEDSDSSGKDVSKGEKAREQFTTFGRGKGTVFLVNRKTRAVIWSTYERPKNATPEQLNKAASRIVERLKGK